ncbi:MAG TPA: hypothetical protein VF412_12715 [Bdellovibrio sp.]|uniref:hypothetical protein n=1 Tax=Bdellovibrio sp. TaxID=28201 RepID=UPI002EE9D35C
MMISSTTKIVAFLVATAIALFANANESEIGFALAEHKGNNATTDANISFQGSTFDREFIITPNFGNDLYPTASLKWDEGLNSYSFNGSFNPFASYYDSITPSNVGFVHSIIDLNANYTYSDSLTGLEISAALGMILNFANIYPSQNETDIHLDVSISQYLSKDFFLGLIGCYCHQLSTDPGSGVLIGDFRASAVTVGYQFGYLFPMYQDRWSVSLRNSGDFDAQNHFGGWNTSVTLAIPL